jgi:beta-phosphoglucomutase-like phosphatase (HAD superfamily)
VIFDVDGVLVASPHERAWREALEDLMLGPWRSIRPQTTWSPESFTPLVYQTLVSGRSRLSGARAALEHFGLPDDADAHVMEYADLKQQRVARLIADGEFAAYPDGLRLVISCKRARLRIAAASSSKNAAKMMSRIRLDTFVDDGIASPVGGRGDTLLDAFDVDVSGRDFDMGKPHPAMFLAAASELGCRPDAVVVVEDAPAGVLAAKAAGMAAIGIARADDFTLLDEAGADIVVTTLDDVDVDEVATLTVS